MAPNEGIFLVPGPAPFLWPGLSTTEGFIRPSFLLGGFRPDGLGTPILVLGARILAVDGSFRVGGLLQALGTDGLSEGRTKRNYIIAFHNIGKVRSVYSNLLVGFLFLSFLVDTCPEISCIMGTHTPKAICFVNK